MPPDWKQLSITERLRVLRAMHNLSQQNFATAIGVAADTDAYGYAERSGNIAQMAPAILARFTEIDAGWLLQGLTGKCQPRYGRASRRGLFQA